MVDMITRRRFILALAALLIVTISLLFIAHLRTNFIHHVLQDEPRLDLQFANVSINDCHRTEPIDVISPCDKCNAYERQYLKSVCLSTGYKETVLCTKSNVKTFRSCPIPAHIQHTKFWYFESSMFIMALISMGCVQTRQKFLDRQMVEKIRRQIGEDEE